MRSRWPGGAGNVTCFWRGPGLPPPRRAQNSPSRTPAVGQPSRVAAAHRHLSRHPRAWCRSRRSGARELAHRTPVPPGHASRASPDWQWPGWGHLTRTESDRHSGGAFRGGRSVLSVWPRRHPHQPGCSALLDGQGDGDPELGELACCGQAALAHAPPLGAAPAPAFRDTLSGSWTLDLLPDGRPRAPQPPRGASLLPPLSVPQAAQWRGLRPVGGSLEQGEAGKLAGEGERAPWEAGGQPEANCQRRGETEAGRLRGPPHQRPLTHPRHARNTGQPLTIWRTPKKDVR